MEEKEDHYNLQRFIEAQNSYQTFDNAMKELRNGKKQTHWIWFIFPQLKGLGHSYNSEYYGISGLEEAHAYLKNKILNERLRAATQELLHEGQYDLRQVLGNIDYQKALSCITLFDAASPNDLFNQVLESCFEGRRDKKTLNLLQAR